MKVKILHRGFYNCHGSKKVCLLGEDTILEVLYTGRGDRYVCQYGDVLVQVEFENCDECDFDEEPTEYQELWTLR